MKNIVILGSTGSIGTQTLSVVSEFSSQYNVLGLSAGKNIPLLETQIKQFSPSFICVQDAEDIKKIDSKLIKNITCFHGNEGLVELCAVSCDLSIIAISGTAAIKATAKAIETKNTIGLACKEVLVSAGNIIMKLAKQHNVPILPVDSEHAAIKQCLAGVKENSHEISKLTLTASGGPFFKKTRSELESITVEQALKHPNWSMGKKISIDSATLMNKGLEVIEAQHLFDMPLKRIQVVVHPSSIVHSLVEFVDGTFLAQLSEADMRLPIQYVMSYPEKQENSYKKLSLTELPPLEFFKPDLETFPLLQLAYDTGSMGGNAPAIMNAANEAAVNLFLKKKIGFLDIFDCVASMVEKKQFVQNPSLEDIILCDKEVKETIQYDYA